MEYGALARSCTGEACKAEGAGREKDGDGKNIGNFRFKIYLKSNLERIFCTKDGEISWVDKNGKTVQIEEYQKNFPELVQKIYTKKAIATYWRQWSRK